MWSSSNMFLKKLITNNLCFPRSTSSSTPTPSCPAAAGLTDTSDHKSSTDNQQIIKNFNTLYASSKSTTPDDDVLSSFFTSSSYSDHHPDFTTVFASQRFFFSSPGHSKSLIHQSTPPPPPDHDNNDIDERNSSGAVLLSAGGVPVPKYSPDPYSDFRLSMQEMVEARVSQSKDPTENWEYLHQLLTCYLSLNPKNTHECIIKAFSDLVVNFLFDKDNDATRQNVGRRRRSVSRRLL